MHGHAEQARVAAGLVRSFQITSVFDELSVLENLQVAVQRSSIAAMASSMPARVIAPRVTAMTVARRVGLRSSCISARRSSRMGRGAGWMWAGIACGPRVLLMDEPMAGMGHEESATMIALIQSLKEELTVVLVEHDMEAVFALADRMTVLVQGAVLATGSVERSAPMPRSSAGLPRRGGNAMSALLEVEGLTGGYGASQGPVRDRHAGQERRSGDPAGPQWHGQDHHAAHHPGIESPDRRRGALSWRSHPQRQCRCDCPARHRHRAGGRQIFRT
jgi:ABC-type branched-subunit amino acid transport system ATPase component